MQTLTMTNRDKEVDVKKNIALLPRCWYEYVDIGLTSTPFASSFSFVS